VKADDVVDTVQHRFATNLCEVIMQVLGAVSGSVWHSFDIEEMHEQKNVDDICLSIDFKGSISGEAQLELPHDGVIILASILLGRSTEEVDGTKTGAILNLANRAMTDLQKMLSPTYGAFEATCSLLAEDTQDKRLERVPNIVFSISDDTSNQLTLRIRMSDVLVQTLETLKSQNSERTKAGCDDAGELVASANLDLVLDVELSVTLRFGRRQLTLREVLELTSGSVIELDRQVEEPVELILDGKVIARGEAVVIDGNYGLRVTEVPHAISTTMI
jgi:flagellar motor switch protein FliN/FliY